MSRIKSLRSEARWKKMWAEISRDLASCYLVIEMEELSDHV